MLLLIQKKQHLQIHPTFEYVFEDASVLLDRVDREYRLGADR